ncbi:DUF2809 domain-containing protein [Ruegeria sp. ANG-R]|uniref:ribosomal maturation YjgA family protein n=1 Tax=Ruegeria sp. ANG-R TaxID=1577903 RepID=UPI00068F6EF1|nr:DUF2809 domain-containing protein [Ruegeria sp. ANG-R]
MPEVRFSIRHFVAALLLFTVLVVIAMFVRDSFVRPFVGDAIVVTFLYCLVGSVFGTSNPTKLALTVVLFSFAIEFMQYFEVLSLMGLNGYPALRVVFGATFDWMDLISYSLGGCAAAALEVTTMRETKFRPLWQHQSRTVREQSNRTGPKK